ncbi:MAG: hypothetical protein ABEH59_00630 [Halobacteriales archaeon]
MLIPFYCRPLGEMLRPWFDAGFLMVDLLEPPPAMDDDLLG